MSDATDRTDHSRADTERQPIRMPDIGAEGAPVSVSLWLVSIGDAVEHGDRVVEIVLAGTTFDVSTPVSGHLAKIEIHERGDVHPGDILGWVTVSADDES